MAQQEAASLEYSDSVPGASLEAVLRTEELTKRPTREQSREMERKALHSLLRHLGATISTASSTLPAGLDSVLAVNH